MAQPEFDVPLGWESPQVQQQLAQIQKQLAQIQEQLGKLAKMSAVILQKIKQLHLSLNVFLPLYLYNSQASLHACLRLPPGVKIQPSVTKYKLLHFTSE